MTLEIKTDTQLELNLAVSAAKELVERLPDGYSHTAELFDACLKWSSRRVREVAEVETHSVVFRNQTYTVERSPAVIKGRNGKSKIVMPGKVEHDVLHAVRKIAAEDESRWAIQMSKKYVEMESGFSLYEIRKILAAEGCGHTSSEIEEALHVLAHSKIHIIAQNGEAVGGVISGIFQSLVYSKKKRSSGKTKENADKQFNGWVKLHPLVTRSILDKSYRRVNFKLMMSCKNRVAQWLYERLCHIYTQAGHDALWDSSKTYHIALDTIEREGPIPISPETDRRRTIQEIRQGIEELIKAEVIFKTSEDIRREPIAGKRGRPPISQVVWTLNAGSRFIEDMVAENSQRAGFRQK